MIEHSLRILEQREKIELQKARTKQQRIQTRSKYFIARSQLKRLLVIGIERLN